MRGNFDNVTLSGNPTVSNDQKVLRGGKQQITRPVGRAVQDALEHYFFDVFDIPIQNPENPDDPDAIDLIDPDYPYPVYVNKEVAGDPEYGTSYTDADRNVRYILLNCKAQLETQAKRKRDTSRTTDTQGCA